MLDISVAKYIHTFWLICSARVFVDFSYIVKGFETIWKKNQERDQKLWQKEFPPSVYRVLHI